LRYHVIAGQATKSTDWKVGEDTTLTTEEPFKQVTISKLEDDKVLVKSWRGGAIVKTADVIASNGVVHIVDSVLNVPNDIVDEAKAKNELSTFFAAVTKAGLANALKAKGPYTVFAPTDQAFTDAGVDIDIDSMEPAELAKILNYHVIEGRFKTSDWESTQIKDTLEKPRKLTVTSDDYGVFVGRNRAEVATANIEAWNGVVHTVKKVLAVQDIVEKASDTSTLKKLAAAVAHAGLVNTLKGEGPFTVFAPSDDAFKQKYPNTDGDVSGEDANVVKSLLRYHVIKDQAIFAYDLEQGDNFFESLEAAKQLTVTADLDVGVGGEIIVKTVKVGTANVIVKSVPTWNGVVHIIDEVLELPAGNLAIV